MFLGVFLVSFFFYICIPRIVVAIFPIVYVVAVAPRIISTFSIAFLFMLVPDRIAVSIATIAIFVVSVLIMCPMKNGRIAGSAPIM